MTIMTRKFSQFVNAGNLANNETTVGLNTGINAYFNNPWTFLPPGSTANRPPITAAIYYQLRLNTDTQQYEYYNPTTTSWVVLSSSNELRVWNNITIPAATMAVNNGYVANSATLCVLTLPAVAAFGSTIYIQGANAGLFQIGQPTGVTIHYGNQNTSTGISGYLQSTGAYDSVLLLNIIANTDWAVLLGPQGNIIFN